MSYQYARVFGKNIKDQMDKQNIELYELSNYMGFNMDQTMKLLNGKLMLSLHEMDKIADFLGVNIIELGKNRIR